MATDEQSNDSTKEDNELRQRIAGMLPDKPTKGVAVAASTDETAKIIDELRRPENEKLEKKLEVSLVTSHPVDGKRCQECIYYLTNREFCDLPEHKFPVSADWWCRLWRL